MALQNDPTSLSFWWCLIGYVQFSFGNDIVTSLLGSRLIIHSRNSVNPEAVIIWTRPGPNCSHSREPCLFVKNSKGTDH